MADLFTPCPPGKNNSVGLGQPDISIVIVSWNAQAFLLECLRSVSACLGKIKGEIIVVDNASQDGSAEMVETLFGQVRLIKNSENLGFARANNIGISLATGRYVCLINSDVKILDGCIERLCKYMDAHPEIGLAGPKILNPDLTIQSSCRRFPSLWNNFCSAVWLNKVFPKSCFFGGEHMLFFPHDRIARVNVIVGCFMIVRRQALELVGLLDERFFIYHEDIDWCRRFWKAGWEVAFFPNARAIHYRGASSSNAPIKFAAEQDHAILQYWKKYYRLPSQIAILVIIILNHIFRIGGGALFLIIKPSKKTTILRNITKHYTCLLSLFSYQKLAH